MVAKSFEVGDLVWAKMKGYPYWPSKIIDPPAAVTPKAKKFHHYVLFYGYDNHAWIPDELILLHNEKLVAKFAAQKKKPAMLQEAVDKIVSESKSSSKSSKGHGNKVKHDDNNEVHESNFEKLTNKDVSFKSSSVSKSIKRKVPMKKISLLKKVVRKRPSSDIDEAENDGISKSLKISRRTDDDQKAYATLFANIPPNIGYSEDAAPQSQGLLSRRNYVERPPTPPIDLESKNEILSKKNIEPTSKKIGFLGLGKLGQGIVKNLLQSGHSVTIWNRTTAKCDPFKDIGAEVASTPADVIEASDITFGCVSDTDAAKRLFFGNCGILRGLEVCNKENKGYVEMTSMDPKTSEAIAEEVKHKKGRYLEAPLTGSRVKAIEGTLFILAAGDRTLYDECESCFHAIADESKYIGTTIGSASKYNIIHNTLVGSVYACLAESLALVKRTGMNGNEFLDILQHGILDNKEIYEKGKLMLDSEYTSNTPLKHVQKDLKLALSLGSFYQQPLPVTAIVNETYKRLKLRYADHDISAVFEGTKG